MSGIYLEQGRAPAPTVRSWTAAHALLEGELTRHSATPGYVLIDKFSGPLKYRKYGAVAHQRRLADGFGDVETVGFATTPPGVGEPGWNWIAQADLSYQKGNYGRLSLEFLVEDVRCAFGSSAFAETLKRLAAFVDWDFGWCMLREKGRGVETYLGGNGATDEFTPEDHRRTDCWYEAFEPDDRRRRIRDVFSYNLVNAEQLAFPVGSATLREFILADPSSSLAPLSATLSSWQVEAGAENRVRDLLLGTGLIVAS
ncbi:MAG: hypothetical protein HY859_17220 [Caulobacterales bacterium]|nr:hypothetical protein [Caulobacterales bacterium]